MPRDLHIMCAPASYFAIAAEHKLGKTIRNKSETSYIYKIPKQNICCQIIEEKKIIGYAKRTSYVMLLQPPDLMGKNGSIIQP